MTQHNDCRVPREKTHRMEHCGGFTLTGGGSVLGIESGGGDAGGGGDGDSASYISGESGKTGKIEQA